MGKEGTKEKLDIELEAPADFTSRKCCIRIWSKRSINTILP